MFETLGAQGTNIIIQDGVEVVADVYARTQDDNLGLMWEIQQGDPSAIQATAKKVSEAFWFIGKQATEKKPSQSPTSTATVNTDEEDERIKHLRRKY